MWPGAVKGLLPGRSRGGAAAGRCRTALCLCWRLSWIQEKATRFLALSAARQPPLPPASHPRRSRCSAQQRWIRLSSAAPTSRAARTVSRCLRSASRMRAAICGDREALRGGPVTRRGVRGGFRTPHLADVLLLALLVRSHRLLQRRREPRVFLRRHHEPLPQRRIRAVLPPEPRRLPPVFGPGTGRVRGDGGHGQHRSAAPRPPPAARSYPARCCRSPAWGRANAPLLPSLRTPRPQHRHHTRRSCSAGS